jgi:hypothetical protein
MGIKRYVFIVTYGRSGSTILQKIIGKAPGFFIAGANPDNCYKISYEDFTTNIETLVKLLKFPKAELPRKAAKQILATILKH